MLLALSIPLSAPAKLPIKQACINSTNCVPSRTTSSISLTPLQIMGPSFIAPITQKPISTSTSQPQLLSQQEAPFTGVLISGGQVDVQLINRTDIAVSYEAIQETDYAQLSPGKRITLQDLRTPTTILLDRMDRGNLRISTRVFPRLLEVSLYPAANFNEDKGVVRIQESGAVYLN